MPFDARLTPASCCRQTLLLAHWGQLVAQFPMAADATVALVDLSTPPCLQGIALEGDVCHTTRFLLLQQEPMSERGVQEDVVQMVALSAKRMEQVMIRFPVCFCVNNSRVALMNGQCLTPEALEEAALLMRLSQGALPPTWLILQPE